MREVVEEGDVNVDNVDIVNGAAPAQDEVVGMAKRVLQDAMHRTTSGSCLPPWR